MLQEMLPAHVIKRAFAINGAHGSFAIKKICAKSRKFRNPEKRLDEHNNYASKFGEIQTDIAVIKNDIKTLYKENGQ